MATKWQLTDQLKPDELKPAFAEVVPTYLQVYAEMGRQALAAAASGQCQPLSLQRLADGNVAQVEMWFAGNGQRIDRSILESVTAATPFTSLFDQSYLDLWTERLNRPLEEARSVFEALNAAS